MHSKFPLITLRTPEASTRANPKRTRNGYESGRTHSSRQFEVRRLGGAGRFLQGEPSSARRAQSILDPTPLPGGTHRRVGGRGTNWKRFAAVVTLTVVLVSVALIVQLPTAPRRP